MRQSAQPAVVCESTFCEDEVRLLRHAEIRTAVTHDGRLLLATNKRGQSVSVFDARTGKELRRLPTRRKVVHGVAVSPDDKYAFVSVEGVGSEPGTVEAIDLGSLTTVGTG